MYSYSEQTVLSYFFTNIDSDIYCATDSMPTSLWALLLGGYSRSNKSLRDRLLQVFADVAKEQNIEYIDYIVNLSNSITYSSVNLKNELIKADKFMNKWAFEYGHNSLKDSSVNRIAIENVSIRATKFLENSSLGAFQEKSTRYMDFSNDSLYLLSSVSNTPDNNKIDELNKKAMTIYSETLPKLIEYYKVKINSSEFKSENAWLRTCKAKAFDDARYLLPSSVKTSLGVSMPTREIERWISYLLSSANDEVIKIAEKIKEECIKITPALISHANINPFLNTTFNKLGNRIIANSIGKLKNIPMRDKLPGVTINYISEIELELVYSFLNSIGYYSLEDVSELGLSLDDIYKLVLEDRGPFDEMPSCAAIGTVNFDIICDIGAYRDIQRHRVGTQLPERWMALRGYSIPDSFEDPELLEVKNQYISIFEEVSEFNKELVKKLNFNFEYCILLGHNIRLNYSCDLKQLTYIIELRSGEAGHYSYRRIAQELYRLFSDECPNLSKYIRVNMSGYVDRRKQEEIIQENTKKIVESDDFDE